MTQSQSKKEALHQADSLRDFADFRNAFPKAYPSELYLPNSRAENINRQRSVLLEQLKRVIEDEAMIKIAAAQLKLLVSECREFYCKAIENILGTMNEKPGNVIFYAVDYKDDKGQLITRQLHPTRVK